MGGGKISLSRHTSVLIFYWPLDDDPVLIVALGQRDAVKPCFLDGWNWYFDCCLAVRVFSDRAPQMPKSCLVYSIAPADRRFPAIQLRMELWLESSRLWCAVSAKVARRKDETRYHPSWVDKISRGYRRLRRP